MGPLISEGQRATVRGYVESGSAEGATIVTGGDAPDDPALAGGSYLRPCVLSGVDNDMTVARRRFGQWRGVALGTEADAYASPTTRSTGVRLLWTRDLGRACGGWRADGVLSVN